MPGEPSRDRQRSEPRGQALGSLRLLERHLLTAGFAATAAALLLAARNGLAPDQAPLTHGLVFWGWFLMFYAALALPAWLALSAASRWPSLSRLPRVFLGIASLGFLGICFCYNLRAIQQLATLEGPVRFQWLLPAGFTLSCLGLLSVGLLPPRRRAAPRVLALLTVAASLGGLAPLPQQAAGASTLTGPLRMKGERVLLVGLDGADWGHMESLIARGELPNLEQLRRRGVWGPLETIQPTLSPAIWTTMATGKPPSEHRIQAFTRRRIRGVDDALGRLRPLHALGFSALSDWLQRSGEIHESPISSLARRVPAFWELTTSHKSPVNVINWWATWPAEAILGNIVSEHVYFWRLATRDWPRPTQGLTHPPELYGEIAGLIMRPDEVTFEHARPFMNVSAAEFEAMNRAPFRRHTIGGEFKYFYSMFETNRRIALHLMETGRRRYSVPPDMLVLFRLVDMAAHASLRESELVDEHLGAPDEDLRRFGRVVSEAYRTADRALGELVRAFGDGNVIVVSDHGFELVYQWPDWSVSYGHANAPEGIFVAAGPAFGRGKVGSLSVFDVLPVLARLKDLPIAEDLPGHVPGGVLRPGFLAEHPVRLIASYGRRGPRTRAEGSREVNREMLDRLRALGYVE